jgi:hypothetical protein
MHSSEILSILELILWAPTLFLAVYVCYVQGFSKQLGWLSLVLLGFFRILGASTFIAALSNPSTGLIECSVISSSVGLISLVGSLTGLTFRIQQNLPQNHSLLGPFPARVVHLATTAALILSILAGTDFADTNSLPDIEQGKTFIKAAVGLLTGVYVFVGGLALYTRAVQRRHIVAPGEDRLLLVTNIALPFIAVRLVYGWLGACLGQDSIFSIFSDDRKAVIARALMQILMELVVAWCFLWAGFTVPKSERKRHQLHFHGLGNGAPGQQSVAGQRGGRTAMLERGLHSVWHSGEQGGTQTAVEGGRKPETSVNEV